MKSFVISGKVEIVPLIWQVEWANLIRFRHKIGVLLSWFDICIGCTILLLSCQWILWCSAHLPRSKLLLKILRRCPVDVARSESCELSKDGHRPSKWIQSWGMVAGLPLADPLLRHHAIPTEPDQLTSVSLICRFQITGVVEIRVRRGVTRSKGFCFDDTSLG